jgi:hypothetical protein
MDKLLLHRDKGGPDYVLLHGNDYGGQGRAGKDKKEKGLNGKGIYK